MKLATAAQLAQVKRFADELRDLPPEHAVRVWALVGACLAQSDDDDGTASARRTLSMVNEIASAVQEGGWSFQDALMLLAQLGLSLAGGMDAVRQA